MHRWFARAFDLADVTQPRAVLAIADEGVLEEETSGFWSASMVGCLALLLLQTGGVAVIVSSLNSGKDVRQRLTDLHLWGGVAEGGATLFGDRGRQESSLLTPPGQAQLDRLRNVVVADERVLVHDSRGASIRVSQLIDSQLRPLPGPGARQLLDREDLDELTFWVASWYTDFVTRAIDKGAGLLAVANLAGLGGLPLAVIGGGDVDLPMLEVASVSFVPMGTLPGFTRRQAGPVVRSRYAGDQALLEAAYQLVPSPALRRRALNALEGFQFPDWFPESLRRRPVFGTGPIRTQSRRWRPTAKRTSSVRPRN